MSSSSSVSGLALFFLWLVLRPCAAIRAFPFHSHGDQQLYFAEAPQYRNGADCPAVHTQGAMASCDPSLVHIAMTLDLVYIRGTMAAVHSVLMHGSCPEDIYFHFIAASGDGGTQEELRRLLLASFPSLQFRIYTFHEDEVARLISPSVRDALDRPLNYARNQIPHLLGSCVDRVIYLDSDVILVDDIKKLWDETRDSGAVIAAPEYCNANFTSYFTEGFWRNPVFRRTFEGRRSSQPCYFNTGVMVMDLAKWRAGDYEERIRRWMEIQRRATPRIYELGSLPPFMLVFAGDVHGVDHRWNQHGLGGDNANGNCRPLHPGRVSLMHWSGKGKPWVRLDAGNPCPVDFVWKPFDLRVSSPETL